ncbi:nitrile hydratase accessory protein [Hoeflea marina]|uniref:Nitrile hydratase accessory protein n=1 Tax=Hoeflea marina TaxID=274592 RepID=A0A317PGG2_9HYPH|nr:nitrile hydratase accessory protein [Hoeflea marina]PWV99135.1 nitrile hydratase accessory protein [Hoeflea marina]
MNRHESAPGLPDGDGPAFAEPWQAQAFAMTVALHRAGLFSWGEWAEALSAELKRPGAATDGSDYYRHWLAALEGLLAARGVTDPASIEALSGAWQRAAHATPHGSPIELGNDPERHAPASS